ncbi:hypothetical protein [Candidatus Nitronereus thalassa]|uniref:Serine protease n=1 Tax=Candidatus Nitronereus thalassa TaxID=3020898 RepID=A0ABU3KA59_9BACT|nr:hypothetical protein [Candidatus Nitronereus thalassa]MDT7043281.1 hypothetical protein [Candidatus Nitronereus thalassa]
MKGIRLLLVALAGTAFMATVAFANPALLSPKPGYPIGATKSPVDGTRTSHDAGQTNAVGAATLEKSASFHDSEALNEVEDPNRMRIKASKGAGRLPEVEGPLNQVNPNPAGATSTVIN